MKLRFAIAICLFFAGFWAGSHIARPHQEEVIPPDGAATGLDETKPSEIWYEWHDMTFEDMRNSIMGHGGAAFENARGISVNFSNPDAIFSTGFPNVMAVSDCGIHVLFAYRHWRYGWGVVAYNRHGRDWWSFTPEIDRGALEGRRYVEADVVTVRLYAMVDWGGGETAEWTEKDIPGENFFEEFIPLLHQHIGVKLLDAWYIGNRLYINWHLEDFLSMGTSGEHSLYRALLMTLFSLPNVEEVVVLINGQSESGIDHMGVAEVYRRDDPW